MAQHIHKWPIDHSYMRSIVDLRTKLWLPRTKLLDNVSYTNFCFFLSCLVIYLLHKYIYADYATPSLNTPKILKRDTVILSQKLNFS